MDVGEMDLIRRMIDERFGAAPDVSAFESRLQLIEQESATLRGIVADMQVAQSIATVVVQEAAAEVEESAAEVAESAEQVAEAAIMEELAESIEESLEESEEMPIEESPPMEPATPQEDTGGRMRWWEKPIALPFGGR